MQFHKIGSHTKVVLVLGLMTSLTTAHAQSGSQRVEMTASRPTYTQVLETSIQEARKTRKNVLIEFYFDGCTGCEFMKKKILLRPQVQQQLSQNFIVARVNGLKDDGRDLAGRYQVQTYPSYIAIRDDGRPYYRITGASTSPERFLDQLQSIMKTSGNTADMTSLAEDYELHKYDPGFVGSYLESLKAQGDRSGKGQKAFDTWFAKADPNEILQDSLQQVLLLNNVSSVRSAQFRFLNAQKAALAKKHGRENVEEALAMAIGSSLENEPDALDRTDIDNIISFIRESTMMPEADKLLTIEDLEISYTITHKETEKVLEAIKMAFDRQLLRAEHADAKERDNILGDLLLRINNNVLPRLQTQPSAEIKTILKDYLLKIEGLTAESQLSKLVKTKLDQQK
ncbi:putative disulphide-isomerase [Pedobacter sp. BAL39]|uniref:thioredoxin family protein n=1 Tax=Pedobacter sp. BAL39 TaxID=391596 RepID=UPI0001559BF6|nr:thioredoxin family protein [Pedobacter sp. BAL39]EDM36373.1 putative disulphide-isomerase [Pedobacter sp. BAL39]